MPDDAPLAAAAAAADKPGPEAEQVPARVPAPAPAPASGPSTAPPVSADTPDPEARTGALSAAEEATLGELLERRAAAAANDDPRVRVEAPHSAFTYGGVTVGNEFSHLPGNVRAAFLTAALEAGVTVTQEE